MNNCLFIVSSSQYGAWVFTTSYKAWKFMEKAITLDCKYKTGWHFNIINTQQMGDLHHILDTHIVEKIDKKIEDLKEVIKYVDNLDLKNLYEHSKANITE